MHSRPSRRAHSNLAFAALALATLAFACGNGDDDSAASSPGSFAVSGSTAATSLEVVSFGAGVTTLPANTEGVNETDQPITLAILGSSDRAGFCPTSAVASSTGVSLAIFSAGATVATGDYPIVAGNTKAGAGQATGAIDIEDSSCETSTEDDATGGSVTVTAVDSTHLQGSFSLTFADGTLSGSFDVPLCLDLGALADAGTATCTH